MGIEIGALAPGFYEFSPGIGSWYLAGEGYGRLWLSVFPGGTLESRNSTVVQSMGPEFGCSWSSLVTPQNDPTQETVWTLPYYKTNSRYSGKQELLLYEFISFRLVCLCWSSCV